MTTSNGIAQSNWLRRLITPPHFADEEKTRAAQFLNAILLVGIVLLGIRLAAELLTTGTIFSGNLPLVVLIAIMMGLLVVLRRGYVQAASIVLLGLGLTIMVYIAGNSEGIRDGAFFALMILVVMASLLIDWKASAVIAALSIAAGWALANKYSGTPQTLGPTSAITYARDTSFVFAMIVVLMYLVTSSLRRALQRSQSSEQNLREQNAELMNFRLALEQRVAERTAQLNTSVEVGRAAASILAPDQLLDQIVDLIAERFDFYYVAIFTLNTAGDNAVLRAATGEAGRILKEGGHKLPLSIDSMVGYAINKRKPRTALDVGKDAVRFANPLLPETRSEIALPLTVGNDVLGALDVQSKHAGAFDETNIAVLQSMASQIAVALANAHSFERMQKSLEYTQRQFDVGRALFAAKNPTEAYLALGEAWALLPHVDRLQIYLVSARDVNAQPSEYELVMEWDIIAGVQVNLGQFVAAADVPLIAIGQFDRQVVIPDVNNPNVPRRSRTALLQAGAQSAVLSPVRFRDQFEGMLVATTEFPTDYSESELNLVTAVTDQLAIVLSNLRLTEQMQATVRRVERLNLQLSGEAWQRYIAMQPEIVIDSGRPPLTSLASRVELPIQVHGQSIGSFTLEDADSARQWSTEELTLFQTIANEVALAIDKARLIEQTQRAAQREKDIARAADKIHRASDLEEILRTAVFEISRITGMEDVAVQVGTETLQGNGQHG